MRRKKRETGLVDSAERNTLAALDAWSAGLQPEEYQELLGRLLADLAIRRYLEEGSKLIRDVTARYAN